MVKPSPEVLAKLQRRPLNAFEALEPKEQLAVTLFTNPLYGRVFNNKLGACQAAGFKTGHFLSTDKARAAVEFLNEQRDEEASVVRSYLARYSPDAVKRLIKQAMDGAELEYFPVPHEWIEAGGRENMNKVRIAAQHNRAVAAARKEALAAMSLLLAYHLGPPESQLAEEPMHEESELAKLSPKDVVRIMRALKQGDQE